MNSTRRSLVCAALAATLAAAGADLDGDRRTGILVEYDDTNKIFTQPSDQRTEDYITGRFG